MAVIKFVFLWLWATSKWKVCETSTFGGKTMTSSWHWDMFCLACHSHLVWKLSSFRDLLPNLVNTKQSLLPSVLRFIDHLIIRFIDFILYSTQAHLLIADLLFHLIYATQSFCWMSCLNIQSFQNAVTETRRLLSYFWNENLLCQKDISFSQEIIQKSKWSSCAIYWSIQSSPLNAVFTPSSPAFLQESGWRQFPAHWLIFKIHKMPEDCGFWRTRASWNLGGDWSHWIVQGWRSRYPCKPRSPFIMS